MAAPVKFAKITFNHDAPMEVNIVDIHLHPDELGKYCVLRYESRFFPNIDYSCNVPLDLFLKVSGFSILGYQWNEEAKKAEMIWRRDFARRPDVD